MVDMLLLLLVDDVGFIKDELIQQLLVVDSIDSVCISLILKVVSNFEVVDINSDGKVSFQEVVVYDELIGGMISSSVSSDVSSIKIVDNSDVQIMQKIMQLMYVYGSNQEQSGFGIVMLFFVLV